MGHGKQWGFDSIEPSLRLRHGFKLNAYSVNSSRVFPELIFTNRNSGRQVVYTHTDQYYYPMPETVEHRNIRCKKTLISEDYAIIDESPLIEEIVSYNHLFILLFNVTCVIEPI